MKCYSRRSYRSSGGGGGYVVVVVVVVDDIALLLLFSLQVLQQYCSISCTVPS